MTTARMIELFRNDIMITIADTERKAIFIHNGDPEKVRADVEHRVQAVWHVSLADLGM